MSVDGFLEDIEIKRSNCPHEAFSVYAEVGRISVVDDGPVVYFSLGLKVVCSVCGQSLEFVGVPHGLSAYHPTVSINKQEVRIPMVIPGKMVPSGLPGFGVRSTVQVAEEATKH